MACSIAVTSSPKELVNLAPFTKMVEVMAGAVGSPVVQTIPAPPSEVPAEALPSVYMVVVGSRDLI